MSVIDVAALRNRIVEAFDSDRASSLGAELGTYRWSGNTRTTPAIRVEGIGGGASPGDPIVSGLEVVIRPEYQTPFTPLLGNESLVNYRSQITLKQWDTSASIAPARDLLCDYLRSSLVEVSPISYRDKDLDSLEQVQLILSDVFCRVVSV